MSSRLEAFCEKGVPKSFTKVTGKHLYGKTPEKHLSFLIQLQAYNLQLFPKRDSDHVLSYEIRKILKKSIFAKQRANTSALWNMTISSNGVPTDWHFWISYPQKHSSLSVL